MKHVHFLIPEGLIKPSSLFGAIEVFEKANEFYTNNGKRPYYDVKIVGAGADQTLLNTALQIRATEEIPKMPPPDLILIPGLHERNNYSIKKNKELIDWMVDQYRAGTELASLCTGAFLLAATGLLKGRECSTHWKAGPSFQEMFPDVKLRTDKVLTDSKGIYTAGGATSSLNLILYLVEKFNGREAALYCAKVLQIDIDRSSQSPFMFFAGQKDHDDEQIKNAQHFIESNIEERITVDALADKFAISRRSFVRRFKKATNNVPIEYIQRVKIEAAKKNLEMNRKNVNEVMYAVGYTDIKAFRTIFKKITGLSPVDYRNKYNKDFYPEHS